MPLMRRFLTQGLTSCAVAALTRAARAEDMPAPTGKPILTVPGKIGVFNDGKSVRFDRAMLEEFGMTRFTTVTPWYDGPVTFEGVSMGRLIQAVRAEGDMVIATALNDYETRIPVSDFTQFPVILALKRDGEYMPIRDKGPLFIVYHYDIDAALKTQNYFGRSAWQLSRIVVI